MFINNQINLEFINILSSIIENNITLIHFSVAIVFVTPIILLGNKSDKKLKALQGGAGKTVITKGGVDLYNWLTDDSKTNSWTKSGESSGSNSNNNNNSNNNSNSNSYSNNSDVSNSK